MVTGVVGRAGWLSLLLMKLLTTTSQFETFSAVVRQSMSLVRSLLSLLDLSDESTSTTCTSFHLRLRPTLPPQFVRRWQCEDFRPGSTRAAFSQEAAASSLPDRIPSFCCIFLPSSRLNSCSRSSSLINLTVLSVSADKLLLWFRYRGSGGECCCN